MSDDLRQLLDAYDALFAEQVERWYMDEGPNSLQAFLGITDGQYATIAERRRVSALPDLLTLYEDAKFQVEHFPDDTTINLANAVARLAGREKGNIG